MVSPSTALLIALISASSVAIVVAVGTSIPSPTCVSTSSLEVVFFSSGIVSSSAGTSSLFVTLEDSSSDAPEGCPSPEPPSDVPFAALSPTLLVFWSTSPANAVVVSRPKIILRASSIARIRRERMCLICIFPHFQNMARRSFLQLVSRRPWNRLQPASPAATS